MARNYLLSSEYNFWSVDPIEAWTRAFFFFQASVENLYCSPQLGASGSCYILTLETFILSELLDILHARFVSIIEIILLLSENFLILVSRQICSVAKTIIRQ